MIIREFEPNDLESTLNMDGRNSKRREDKFKLVECSQAFYCYIAEEDSKIKGFIIMEELGDPLNHYMVQINVTEKRKGIGKALVQKVFERIASGGHVGLCVNTDNQEAIQFYESLGFERSGHINEYRKGQNKYWYHINL